MPVTIARGIASFMVRFAQERWRDAAGEPHVQWRGTVRHVQTAEEITFTAFADVVAFMQRHLADLTRDAVPEGSPMEREKVLAESVKLWEQFASTYSNMMFEAMERAMKQSDALKQQMTEAAERSLRAWKWPQQTNAETAEALRALGTRIQTLTERVERLEQAVDRQRHGN